MEVFPVKKIVLASVLAALVSVSAVSFAAPIRNPQAGDFKANVNFGFDQEEGDRSAESRFVGGDLTYVLNDKWDIQYINNYTKGDNGNKINEHYVVGNYRLAPYLSIYGGGSYVDTDTWHSGKNSYGYQFGLRGQLPLTDRLQGFASVGVGDDVNSYEIGVGYDITSSWDAHVKYRSASVDVDNYDDDVEGWQVGMGNKF